MIPCTIPIETPIKKRIKSILKGSHRNVKIFTISPTSNKNKPNKIGIDIGAVRIIIITINSITIILFILYYKIYHNWQE
jgi:transposase